MRGRGEFRLDLPPEGDPDAVGHGGLPIAGDEVVRDNHHQSAPAERVRGQGVQIEEPQATSSVARNGHEVESEGEWAVLDQAVTNGNQEVELLLLDKDEIEAKKKKGWTALHLVALNGYIAGVRLLLENEANIEAKNKNGETSLQFAASMGHEAVVSLLLKSDAKVDAQDDKGWTALYWAAGTASKAMVELLLKNGADTEVKSYDSEQTALHAAACSGNLEAVRVLLEYGASPKAMSKKGWTALQWARFYEKEAVEQLLCEKDAIIEEKGRNE